MNSNKKSLKKKFEEDDEWGEDVEYDDDEDIDEDWEDYEKEEPDD